MVRRIPFKLLLLSRPVSQRTGCDAGALPSTELDRRNVCGRMLRWLAYSVYLAGTGRENYTEIHPEAESNA